VTGGALALNMLINRALQKLVQKLLYVVCWAFEIATTKAFVNTLDRRGPDTR
jgi:hypothetical protein